MNANPVKYTYTEENAKLYASLGIKGTTYEIGYKHVERLAGDLTGKQVLDFGCGAGRSSHMLASLGGSVEGVDHDSSMLAEAAKISAPGLKFRHVEGRLPFISNRFDLAVSISVFIELRTKDQMLEVCSQVGGCVKKAGRFIIMTSNPASYPTTHPQKFRNFEHHSPPHLKSGDLVDTKMITKSGKFIIKDTYWKEDDYREALEQTGWQIGNIDFPMPENPEEWDTDEKRVPPFMIITTIAD